MKSFYFLTALLTISNCALAVTDNLHLTFSDDKGSQQTVVFTGNVGNSDKTAGKVVINNEFSLDTVRSNHILISLQDNKGKSRNDPDDLKTLANEKGFTLFLFNTRENVLDIGRVEAEHGICKDYAEKGLHATIVVNQYNDSRNQRVVFLARGIMAAEPSKNRILSSNFDYTAAPDMTDDLKRNIEQSKKYVINDHYTGKLQALIVYGICAH